MWYTSSIHCFPKYQKFRDARYSPPKRKDPCQPSKSARFHRSMDRFLRSIPSGGASSGGTVAVLVGSQGSNTGATAGRRSQGPREPDARFPLPRPRGSGYTYGSAEAPVVTFAWPPSDPPRVASAGRGSETRGMFPGPNSGEGRTPRRSGLRPAKPRPFVVWAIDARPQVVSRKLTRALEGPVLSRDVDAAPARFRRKLPRCSTPATCGWSGTPNTTEWN